MKFAEEAVVSDVKMRRQEFQDLVIHCSSDPARLLSWELQVHSAER